MRTKLSLFFALFSIVLFAQTYKDIDADEFNKLRKGKNVVVIDVRTPEEYNTGHIDNAINIDISDNDFTTKIEKFGKEKQILLYCRSGRRSSNAAKIFVEKGYTNVYNLQGGIISWEKILRSL